MTSYPLGERIEQVFAHHAEQTPDAVAVRQGSKRLTYGELRHEASRVTSSLRDNGIGAGDFVPVLLDRVLPLHQVIDVDFFLPGCPPPAGRIRAVLQDLLDGKAPSLPAEQRAFG